MAGRSSAQPPPREGSGVGIRHGGAGNARRLVVPWTWLAFHFTSTKTYEYDAATVRHGALRIWMSGVVPAGIECHLTPRSEGERGVRVTWHDSKTVLPAVPPLADDFDNGPVNGKVESLIMASESPQLVSVCVYVSSFFCSLYRSY